MRSLLFFVLLVPLASCAVACTRPDVRGVRGTERPPPAAEVPVTTSPASPPVQGGPGTVLVELFTSEGCSSCPSADDVLARLSDERVLTLEFHVDYWDGIGWRDPFSQRAFTDRQQAYAQALGTQVFTPEMVVSGADAFNGNDGAHAQASVESALASPPEAPLTLGVRSGGDVLEIDFTIAGGPPRGALLDVAVVERSRTVHVGAGENGGRTLRHANVVRAFESAPLAAGDGHGARRITMPAGLSHDGASVVAWVQSASSLRVLGAARADVP